MRLLLKLKLALSLVCLTRLGLAAKPLGDGRGGVLYLSLNGPRATRAGDCSSQERHVMLQRLSPLARPLALHWIGCAEGLHRMRLLFSHGDAPHVVYSVRWKHMCAGLKKEV